MRTRTTLSIRNTALAGFVVGVLGSATYVLAGGDVWWFVPRWAEIVFYPGFFVGNCVYAWVTENFFVVVAAGCVAVGVGYAAIAAGTTAVLHWVSRGRSRVATPNMG